MRNQNLICCLATLIFAVGPFPLIAADVPTVAPETVGLSSPRLTAIDQLLADHCAEGKIAGAVAIVAREGKIAYVRAVGSQDLESQTPMRSDSLFRIASMTKPITSVAVMILVEQGKIGLSDPVSKYLPEFAETRVVEAFRDGQVKLAAARRAISIHHLLTHTSGITYGFFGVEPFTSLMRQANVADGLCQADVTLAVNSQRIARLPLKGQPGEVWEYGLSTDILGRVIEVASGTSLDNFLRSNIFDRLAMHDTHFYLPSDKEQRLASLYRPGEDQRVEQVPDGPIVRDALTYSGDYPYRGPRKYFSGGGGLVSTAPDYLRFLQMLLNGGQFQGRRMLSATTVKQMTSNQIGDLEILFAIHGKKFGYGFGIVDQESQSSEANVGTFSWGGIFNTYFFVDPHEKLVAILMTQLYPFDHLTIREDFQKLVNDSVVESLATAAGRAE